mmetsp:Transcript_30855/g.75909  ORF Transcript_30855/g.75909 Transcript_30855/m.75909 type:complete len:126 (-) Transcript_30855:215-592(-)
MTYDFPVYREAVEAKYRAEVIQLAAELECRPAEVIDEMERRHELKVKPTANQSWCPRWMPHRETKALPVFNKPCKSNCRQLPCVFWHNKPSTPYDKEQQRAAKEAHSASAADGAAEAMSGASMSD